MGHCGLLKNLFEVILAGLHYDILLEILAIGAYCTKFIKKLCSLEYRPVSLKDIDIQQLF